MDDLFIGQIVHCKSINELEVIPDGFIAVKDGKIMGIGERENMADECRVAKNTHQINGSRFIMPGFIDCHIHAPQCPNIGIGLDMQLLDWLETYTFPLEANFHDTEFSRAVYAAVVRQTLNNGTTFATYFATNHKESSFILAEETDKAGQRAFIGKTSSNCLSPDYYVETTESSVRDNREFIENVLSLKNDLVQPIVTPRFAVSCNSELMGELGKIAQEYDLHIQSHISENLGEIDLVKETYKKRYAEVYKDANLLNSKCVLAHGVHLEDEELKILSENRTAVAHCPTSNTNLRSGLCDVRRLLNAGIKVGLGTDVAGGNSASILTAIKDALDVSHHLNFIKKHHIIGTGKIDSPETEQNKYYEPLNYKEALYLATLGGAEALASSHKVGNFEVGKEFDALFINVGNDPVGSFMEPSNDVNLGISAERRLLQYLQKFIYVGDDRNIDEVYVAGRRVK